MGVLKIMGSGGDERVEWDASALQTQDPTGLDSLREAERIVEEYQQRKVPIFEVTGHGQVARQVTVFNPYATEIIISLPLAGG